MEIFLAGTLLLAGAVTITSTCDVGTTSIHEVHVPACMLLLSSIPLVSATRAGWSAGLLKSVVLRFFFRRFFLPLPLPLALTTVTRSKECDDAE